MIIVVCYCGKSQYSRQFDDIPVQVPLKCSETLQNYGTELSTMTVQNYQIFMWQHGFLFSNGGYTLPVLTNNP